MQERSSVPDGAALLMLRCPALSEVHAEEAAVARSAGHDDESPRQSAPRRAARPRAPGGAARQNRILPISTRPGRRTWWTSRQGRHPARRARRRPHRDAAARRWRSFAAAAAKKGDVLGVARIAAIQAAKRTSDLIPLCHPLPLTRVAVEFTVDARRAGRRDRSHRRDARAHRRRDGGADRGRDRPAHDL